MKIFLLSLSLVCSLYGGPLFFSPFGPSLVGNSNGESVAIWSGFNGNNYVIQESSLEQGNPWDPSVVLSPLGQDSLSPKVTMNASGQLLYIWITYNGSFYEVQAASGSFGLSPSMPVSLSTNQSSYVDVKIDANGNGVAIWQESRNSGENAVMVANYQMGAGWSVPYQLSSLTSFITLPHIAMHPTSGQAVALWQAVSGGASSIYTSTFSIGAWSTPQILSTPNLNATRPSLTYNNGEMLAVWQIDNGQNTAVQTASFINNAWTNPQLFSLDQTNLIGPQVALNSDGEALIVAHNQSNESNSIVALQRDSMGNWDSFQTISGDDAMANSPYAQFNDMHQAIVIWENDDTQGNGAIRTSKTTFPGVWTMPETLSTQSLENMSPSLTLDNTGYAVAVWRITDTNGVQLQASTLPSFNSGWDPAGPLE